MAKQPPDLLTGKRAKAEWKRLVPLLERVLSPAYTSALALHCQAVADFIEASKQLEETGGCVVRGGQGNAIQNPWLGVRNQAEKRMLTTAAALGLTPASRKNATPLEDMTDADLEAIIRLDPSTSEGGTGEAESA